MNMNQAMLTDLYEFSMANGYCATLPHEDQAVFDIFYRNVPDHGSFVIAAGLQQVVEALRDFHFEDADIKYLRSLKTLFGYIFRLFKNDEVSLHGDGFTRRHTRLSA